MSADLSVQQLTGMDESHLVEASSGQRLQPPVARAFSALQADARIAGFELTIASGFRSFSRQAAIWNGKASGERPVVDDDGGLVLLDGLSPAQQLRAILRYSAIPGTSRHHWGTDLDVYDAAAMEPGYRLQLSPAEVADEGVFGALHQWLDARMAAGESRGFYRPYAVDRGGVAPERWHLSFAPLSVACAARLSAQVLMDCLHSHAPELRLRGQIEQQLPHLMARYVAVAADWCPGEFLPQ